MGRKSNAKRIRRAKPQHKDRTYACALCGCVMSAGRCENQRCERSTLGQTQPKQPLPRDQYVEYDGATGCIRRQGSRIWIPNR